MLLARIDRYMLALTLGTLGSVVGILMSLMVLEHIPRLVEITRLSGHRGYIIGQTILGLLPEYAGIGIVVGVYLAVAMAIRKLSLRGELSVIEATGISPVRWMRMPMLLTLLGALFVLGNQGWLMPWGEQRLEVIGHRMEIGDFGYNLSAGEFNDLGSGVMLYFDSVDAKSNSLHGLIFTDDGRTYNAASGTLSIAPDGEGLIQLVDGQAINHGDSGVMNFAQLTFHVPGVEREGGPAATSAQAARKDTLLPLLQSTDPALRGVAYGRLLWVVLVLAAPALAFILARPPMRSSSAIGLMAGLCLLVAFLKSIALVDTGAFAQPVLAATGVAATWLGVIIALHVWQLRAGPGALDQAVFKAVQKLAKLSHVRIGRPFAPRLQPSHP